MEGITSKCCNSFTTQRGNKTFCINCGEEVDKLTDKSDIVAGISYNPMEGMVSTIETSSTSLRIIKRLGKDKTCILCDDVLCKKCKGKCRYTRYNNIVKFVCSECLEIQ